MRTAKVYHVAGVFLVGIVVLTAMSLERMNERPAGMKAEDHRIMERTGFSRGRDISASTVRSES